MPHLVSLLIFMLPIGAAAGQAAPCSADSAYGRLDFWVGDWDVYAGGQHVAENRLGENRLGENRIVKILDGCAVAEYWRDGRGREGRSLFYFHREEERWKQVWVTDRATERGGVKEKAELDVNDPGTVRFEGEAFTEDGQIYLDRTTLEALHADTVRQHIEISVDGGNGWRTVFDGLYVRRRTG